MLDSAFFEKVVAILYFLKLSTKIGETSAIHIFLCHCQIFDAGNQLKVLYWLIAQLLVNFFRKYFTPTYFEVSAYFLPLSSLL